MELKLEAKSSKTCKRNGCTQRRKHKVEEEDKKLFNCKNNKIPSIILQSVVLRVECILRSRREAVFDRPLDQDKKSKTIQKTK